MHYIGLVDAQNPAEFNQLISALQEFKEVQVDTRNIKLLLLNLKLQSISGTFRTVIKPVNNDPGRYLIKIKDV